MPQIPAYEADCITLVCQYRQIGAPLQFICTINFVMNALSVLSQSSESCRRLVQGFTHWSTALRAALGCAAAVIYSASQRYLQVKRGSPERRM